jgi:hypothetical protein
MPLEKSLTLLSVACEFPSRNKNTRLKKISRDNFSSGGNMKSVLFVLALIAGSQALAAKDCTPYLKYVDGEAASTEYVYPCGADHTVTYRGCKEGEIAYDSVFNGEFYQTVKVTCHNGSFAAPAAPVVHRGCTEGEISYTNVFNGEFYQNETIICHNGRFVPAN